MRERRVSHREHVKRLELRARLKSKYGMTLEEYDRLLADQGEACACCKAKAPLVVDHCHETKRAVALLCSPCNVGLGIFRENPARLELAIAYLRRVDKRIRA